MKTWEILQKARHYISKYGWKRFAFGNKSIGFCAVGAIRAAEEPNRDRGLIARNYLSTVVAGSPGGSPMVSTWNDYQARSKREVLKAFDKAIKNAKRRHIKGD